MSNSFETMKDGRERQHTVSLPFEDYLATKGLLFTTTVAVPSVADTGFAEIYLSSDEPVPLVESFTFSGSANKVRLELYEGVEATGIPMPQFNHSRADHLKGSPTIFTALSGITATNQGTLVFQREYYGQSVVGSAPDYFEKSLKPRVALAPGVGYIVRLTNVSGATSDLSITALLAALRED